MSHSASLQYLIHRLSSRLVPYSLDTTCRSLSFVPAPSRKPQAPRIPIPSTQGAGPASARPWQVSKLAWEGLKEQARDSAIVAKFLVRFHAGLALSSLPSGAMPFVRPGSATDKPRPQKPSGANAVHGIACRPRPAWTTSPTACHLPPTAALGCLSRPDAVCAPPAAAAVPSLTSAHLPIPPKRLHPLACHVMSDTPAGVQNVT